MKISRDAKLFFKVEIRNADGVQPATLGSAYDSYAQAPKDVVLDWCGLKKDYGLMNEFFLEFVIELRKLISRYGKEYKLEDLLK